MIWTCTSSVRAKRFIKNILLSWLKRKHLPTDWKLKAKKRRKLNMTWMLKALIPKKKHCFLTAGEEEEFGSKDTLVLYFINWQLYNDCIYSLWKVLLAGFALLNCWWTKSRGENVSKVSFSLLFIYFCFCQCQCSRF